MYRWTEGRGIFASGSPFDPVHFGGRTLYPSQCNNMVLDRACLPAPPTAPAPSLLTPLCASQFIFPGVGLGATVANARRVSDKMFYAAAEVSVLPTLPPLPRSYSRRCRRRH